MPVVTLSVGITINSYGYWKPTGVNMPALSSLVALQVVTRTKCGATFDKFAFWQLSILTRGLSAYTARSSFKLFSIATNACTWMLAKQGERRINKAFRERRHPSALDQWMNSPFMGQQVGNWSICHALWPKRKPIVHPTLYLTHISIIPSQSTFPFLKYGY